MEGDFDMRKFVTTCIDEKTGYTMVLSEVSFNQAMDWLQREAEKYDKEVYRHEVDLNGLNHFWAGHFNEQTMDYDHVVKFYYDEDRGYLMQA